MEAEEDKAKPSPPHSPADAKPVLPPPSQQPALPTNESVILNPSKREESPHPPLSRPRSPITSQPSTIENLGQTSTPVSQTEARPLNVTDALTYLDAVKIQFQDKPEVYNKFLDIMKDFKSQIIDTPGVIQRVSRLFHGNPYLIQGFNTFLPQGYRIDVSADPSDPNTITVTTPSGITTQNTTQTTHPPRNSREIPGMGQNIPHSFAPQSTLPPLGHGTMSRSLTPQNFHPSHPPPLPAPHFDSPASFPQGLQNTQTTAAASFLGNLNNKNPVEKQPAGEFNHAIQYLNKIKARYADDSNTYKQFLDILQTYQKEQRQIHDSQVYVQVQQLFKDAPDLLAEFKDFLPDIGMPPGGIPIGPPMPLPGPQQWTSTADPSPPTDKSKKAPQPLKRKKKIIEKEPTPVPPTKVAPSRAKKAKHHHKPDTESPTFAPAYPPSPTSQHLGLGQMPHPTPSSHNLQSQMSLSGPAIPTAPPEKLLFFDRARRALENREMYEEFLKLLNLFSKDVLDIKILVERARVFLGDGDLMTDFKDLVGWDFRRDHVEHGPPGSIRTGPPEGLPAMITDEGQGPSYRRVPESEIHLACSGRDELFRSVLNDEWVSHPIWASEEAGFITHKKNIFEEALHKSEEERHEYHVHIEALTRTIGVLEPIQARIDEMTNDERIMFKLKADFGSSGKCIYHRIIKKIYRECGPEVIQALQDCPSVAVPVVLARLKQKDEEWRRAQREWSRTWREVDCKNFYKSLDQQGINFKANDKKNITAKHFVAEIESVKAQQIADGETERSVFGPVGFQLNFSFEDTSVLRDSLKMIYSFLRRSQTQYTSAERSSTETFLRAFVPLLFMFSSSEFDAACGPQDLLEEETNHELGEVRNGRRSTGSSVHSNTVAGDLRHQLQRAEQERALQENSGRNSRAASPCPEPLDDLDTIWIHESTDAAIDSPPTDYHRPFFANTTFYTLLRLLQLLYSRLLMCKEEGQIFAKENHASLLANPVAVELGLDDPNGPSTVLGSMDTLRGGPDEEINVVYIYLLDACEKVFAGELDQGSFEEHMRWFFGNKAFHLFTLDKVIIAMIKQVLTILSDNKCQELLTLLESAQNSEVISNQDIIRYRREAERHAGQDDHLYRVEWDKNKKHMRIQLMNTKDPSIDTVTTKEERWKAYVDTYVLRQPTEWLPKASRQGQVSLRRVLREPSLITREGGKTRIRISLNYRLFYERDSEEVMYRRKLDNRLVQQAKLKREERERLVVASGLFLPS